MWSAGTGTNIGGGADGGDCLLPEPATGLAWTAGSAGVLYSWVLSTGALAQKFVGHSLGITHIARYGPHLFTSSKDGTLKQWDPSASATSNPVATFTLGSALYQCLPYAGYVMASNRTTFVTFFTSNQSVARIYGGSSGRILSDGAEQLFWSAGEDSVGVEDMSS